MKILKFPIIAVLAVGLLNGCTIVNMPVMAPRPSVSAEAAHKCYSPDDATAGYHTAREEVRAGAVMPPAAKSEIIAGCAAVKFQIRDDGKAYNITILREVPAGYGFGNAVSDQVRRSTYKVPTDNKNVWFFVNTAIAPGP